MASGTALVYDDEMTSHKLLWKDPVCDIEVPERLSSCYSRLGHYGLVGRCISLPVREGTEDEIQLVHSSDYVEVVKSTQKMNEEELQKVSANYDAVYFHPTTYRCAKLAVGATLNLVDAVMSGKARNGMALVRTLIVDWDVHHGQGIQYIFDEDPSVLYFSWHRFEHQQFWPTLRESDYDAVGQGKGRGFNINVPWNKVGMGNSDYLAVFLHVLLPVAFEFDPELVLVSAGYDSGIGDPEGQMSATPDCFAHLTHFLMLLAKGKLCLVLEGGYHLRSLSESVCMTIKTLLGDPLPQLSGAVVPCQSALESIHNIRAAHKPFWECLMYEDMTPLQDLSTKPHHLGKTEVVQTDTQLLMQEEPEKTHCEEAIKKTERFLEQHMKEIALLEPSVKTAIAVAESDAFLLPLPVQIVKEMDANDLQSLVSECNAELVKDEKISKSLMKILPVLHKIVEKKVTSCLAISPEVSLSSAIAIKHCFNLKLQKVLCLLVGDIDMNIDLDDGKVLLIHICAEQPGRASTKYNIAFNWKESVEKNDFFSAVLGFILPVAYSYQPDLTVIVVGKNRSLGQSGISLLVSFLQGLAQSRILAVIQDTEANLVQAIAKPLMGDFVPYFGTCAPASKVRIEMIKELREQLQKQWKMLQCSR